MTASGSFGSPIDRRAGFTLIEALAALAITAAFVAVVLPFAGRLVERWWSGEARVQRADAWLRAIPRLTDDLAEAIPISVPADDGTRLFFRAGPRSVVLVRPALSEAAAGLEIVALMIEPSLEGDALVRYARPFGRDLFDADPRDSAAATVVITGPFKLSFAIIGLDGSRTRERTDDEEMPAGVELTAVPTGKDQVPPAAIPLPIVARTNLASLISTRLKPSSKTKLP